MSITNLYTKFNIPYLSSQIKTSNNIDLNEEFLKGYKKQPIVYLDVYHPKINKVVLSQFKTYTSCVNHITKMLENEPSNSRIQIKRCLFLKKNIIYEGIICYIILTCCDCHHENDHLCVKPNDNEDVVISENYNSNNNLPSNILVKPNDNEDVVISENYNSNNNNFSSNISVEPNIDNIVTVMVGGNLKPLIDIDLPKPLYTKNQIVKLNLKPESVGLNPDISSLIGTEVCNVNLDVHNLEKSYVNIFNEIVNEQQEDVYCIHDICFNTNSFFN